MNGFLVLDKPTGLTSREAMMQGLPAEVSPRTTKVGHAGTLDPFATGVLIVLLGHATRLMEYVLLLPKTYEATITLGATSTTDDPEGEIKTPPRPPATPPPQGGDVTAVLQECICTIDQIPPAYAALKVKGKRLYEHARAGNTYIERQPRSVTIYQLDLLEYAYPELKIRVTCSSGT